MGNRCLKCTILHNIITIFLLPFFPCHGLNIWNVSFLTYVSLVLNVCKKDIWTILFYCVVSLFLTQIFNNLWYIICTLWAANVCMTLSSFDNKMVVIRCPLLPKIVFVITNVDYRFALLLVMLVCFVKTLPFSVSDKKKYLIQYPDTLFTSLSVDT